MKMFNSEQLVKIHEILTTGAVVNRDLLMTAFRAAEYTQIQPQKLEVVVVKTPTEVIVRIPDCQVAGQYHEVRGRTSEELRARLSYSAELVAKLEN